MYVVKLKDAHYHLIFDMANIASECIRVASFTTSGKKKTSYQKQLEEIASLTQLLLIDFDYKENKDTN